MKAADYVVWTWILIYLAWFIPQVVDFARSIWLSDIVTFENITTNESSYQEYKVYIEGHAQNTILGKFLSNSLYTKDNSDMASYVIAERTMQQIQKSVHWRQDRNYYAHGNGLNPEAMKQELGYVHDDDAVYYDLDHPHVNQWLVQLDQNEKDWSWKEIWVSITIISAVEWFDDVSNEGAYMALYSTPQGGNCEPITRTVTAPKQHFSEQDQMHIYCYEAPNKQHWCVNPKAFQVDKGGDSCQMGTEILFNFVSGSPGHQYSYYIYMVAGALLLMWMLYGIVMHKTGGFATSSPGEAEPLV